MSALLLFLPLSLYCTILIRVKFVINLAFGIKLEPSLVSWKVINIQRSLLLNCRFLRLMCVFCLLFLHKRHKYLLFYVFYCCLHPINFAGMLVDKTENNMSIHWGYFRHNDTIIVNCDSEVKERQEEEKHQSNRLSFMHIIFVRTTQSLLFIKIFLTNLIFVNSDDLILFCLPLVYLWWPHVICMHER